jgi:class 3 adenylate cyclase
VLSCDILSTHSINTKILVEKKNRLPTASPPVEAADKIAQFAFGVLHLMKSFEEKYHIRMRIGIHSGDVGMFVVEIVGSCGVWCV